MVFDYVLFAKIILWGATIICLGRALLQALGLAVYYFTYAGRMQLIMMKLNGQRLVYTWSYLWIGLIAAVALCCM